MKLHQLLGATALAGTLLVGSAAFAQTTTTEACAPNDARAECKTGQNTAAVDPAQQAANPDADPAVQQGQESGDILVTGSRIARPNLDSAVPVTAITAADLTDTGDLSLGDSLNQLPALRATFSQANSTRAIGTAGLNILDLRGLGTDRTLVLVNGRRHVSSVPGSYNVDINTIPNALLESVEVVTGGQSAVYGSDAIAGVVNFKLKRDYDGINLNMQGGVSERGDRGSYLLSGVVGRNFAEGRGNLAVSAEYAHSESVLFSDRNDQTGAYTGVPGWINTQATSRLVNGVLVNEPPTGDGIPDTRFNPGFPGATFGNLSLGGGVQASCPSIPAGTTGTTLALLQARRAAVCTGVFSPVTGAEAADNFFFLDDGTLVRDNGYIDLRSLAGGKLGGLSATGVEGAMLLPGLDRFNFNGLFNFEFSPALRFFAEGKYAHITNNQTSTQPTFINSTLSPTFSLSNPFLSAQARSTIQTVIGVPSTNTTSTFTLFRFNNDIGTRAENHIRETYRIVAGFRGDISETMNLNYEVAGNYGRTNTFYKTGGNVDVAKFNRATNAALAPSTFTGQNFVLNAQGQRVVCGVNADANTANDDAACYPLNVFGQYNSDPRARQYVLYTSTRNQWAEEINAVGYIAGDSGGLFSLPGGNVGFSLGGEYRKEDAYSDYDDFTQSGATFLNSIAAFDPPAVDVYEGFGELRIPLLKNQIINELTLEGAARYSKYSSMDDGVWAWNAGGVFAPVRDVRFRVTYAKSVRAPNLSDLYSTPSQTFVNGFVDPCNQGAPITSNPNRARNCAAAGVPTTITYTDDQGIVRTQPFVNSPASGIVGINSGNANLMPETGYSFTVGAVFEPSFLRGFTASIDYYNIRVRDVINGLNGQTIINQCYDDPVGLDNPYCAAISRRTSTNSVVNGTFAGQQNRVLTGVQNNTRDFAGLTTGNSFINQPFNYALLKTSGIDADFNYSATLDDDTRVSYRLIVSWLDNREQFTVITAPTQSTRLHGTLGDPEWKGRYSFNLRKGLIDFGYDLNYIGRMSIAAWEVQHTHQGRGPTNLDLYPIKSYAPQITHDLQLGLRVNDQFRFYFGVDNLLDTLPPYGLTGTGAGSGIYNLVGRYFYSGVRLTF